jgi:hypothetical protein
MTGVFNPRSKATEEEIEKIPSYIFCKWLSGNPYTIMAANVINYYNDIPIVNQYEMIRSAFCGKIKYIPYPKNETQKELDDLSVICEYYKISLEKAKEYKEFMSNEEKKLIGII